MKIKKYSQFINEAEAAEQQSDVLKKKLNEYNSKKGQLNSFLNKDKEDELFNKFMDSLEYKDNDLLRYEWGKMKAERDIKKYKELIDKTIKELNSK